MLTNQGSRILLLSIEINEFLIIHSFESDDDDDDKAQLAANKGKAQTNKATSTTTATTTPKTTSTTTTTTTRTTSDELPSGWEELRDASGKYQSIIQSSNQQTISKKIHFVRTEVLCSDTRWTRNVDTARASSDAATRSRKTEQKQKCEMLKSMFYFLGLVATCRSCKPTTILREFGKQNKPEINDESVIVCLCLLVLCAIVDWRDELDSTTHRAMAGKFKISAVFASLCVSFFLQAKVVRAKSVNIFWLADEGLVGEAEWEKK